MIPFSPPRIDQETIDAVTDALRSGWITTGPRTKLFEKRLSEYLNGPMVIALNSWTNACELVLRWYGIGPGDEVIIPAYTYCATANIIKHIGATPVLVDVAEDFNIDVEKVEAKVSERTKCIMPVDIGGFPANVGALIELANGKRDTFKAIGHVQETLGRILILSDSAHSFGATYMSEPVGNCADITGFSFHAVKNLTTAEGGALAFRKDLPFDQEQLYSWFNIMSLHGQSKDALAKNQAGGWRYDVIAPGFKCNMTDIQASIGLVELNRYDSETMPRRRQICESYSAGFKRYDWAVLPRFAAENIESSYHLYMLRIKDMSEAQRDRLIEALAARQISSNVHFQPLPLLTAYQEFRMEDYPVAFSLYENELSLPVYYDMTDDQVSTVINGVVEAVEEIING